MNVFSTGSMERGGQILNGAVWKRLEENNCSVGDNPDFVQDHSGYWPLLKGAWSHNWVWGVFCGGVLWVPRAPKSNTESGVMRGLDYDDGGCFDGAGNGGNEGAWGVMEWANSAKITPFGIIF